jgi:thiamine-phosphate pyrophosphorylase
MLLVDFSPRPAPPVCIMTQRLRSRLQLIYITDARLGSVAEHLRFISAALEGGFTAVQIRLPGAPAREIFELARQARPLAARHEALLLINDRIDVAQAVGADGVHLGHRSLPVDVARRTGGTRHFIIGFSAHDLAELHRATQQGANYCSLSPVFPPNSKEAQTSPLGMEGFQALCRAAHIPVVALGGIGAANAAECRRAGAAGVAVIGTISQAAEPVEAARTLREAWQAGAIHSPKSPGA